MKNNPQAPPKRNNNNKVVTIGGCQSPRQRVESSSTEELQDGEIPPYITAVDMCPNPWFRPMGYTGPKVTATVGCG